MWKNYILYFYPYTGSHVSLSLRGVTIYNNSYINIGDIGARTDDEALQCHTDYINCCNIEHTVNGSQLVEWYYPNGSRVIFINEIYNYSYPDNDGYFTSRSQSVIRLSSSSSSIEGGRFCCEIPDQYGSNQTLCINIGEKQCYSRYYII